MNEFKTTPALGKLNNLGGWPVLKTFITNAYP